MFKCLVSSILKNECMIKKKNSGYIRKVQSSKTEPGRNRHYEQPITSKGIKTVIRNLPKKQKPRARWLHR